MGFQEQYLAVFVGTGVLKQAVKLSAFHGCVNSVSKHVGHD